MIYPTPWFDAAATHLLVEGQLDLRLEPANLGLSAAHDLGGIVRGGGIVVLGLWLGAQAIGFVRIERRHVENSIARHQHARHRHLHDGLGRQCHRVQCTPRLLRLLRLLWEAESCRPLARLRRAHHRLLRLLDCLWRRRRCAWKQWVKQCDQSQYERRAEEMERGRRRPPHGKRRQEHAFLPNAMCRTALLRMIA